VDICRNINKNAAQRVSPLSYTEEAVRNVEIRHIENLEIPYYLRFSVLDKPGVLSRISGVLGNHNISILSVMQKDRKVGGSVPIVIMTHHAKEKELMAALKEIDKMDVVLDKTVYLRIEENLGGGE